MKHTQRAVPTVGRGGADTPPKGQFVRPQPGWRFFLLRAGASETAFWETRASLNT